MLAAVIVFLLAGCSESQPVEPITYEATEKEARRADMITILNHTLGTNGPRYYAIVSNLCKTGKIQHSSHKLIQDQRAEIEKRMSQDQGPAYVQEFRQNIQDLQNRVYELENQ